MIGPEQIAEIIDCIVQELAPEKIILFGSHARGEAREDSDVDLLVVAETDLPLRPVSRRPSSSGRFPGGVRRVLEDARRV